MFVSGPNASATTGMTSWIQPDGAHALYVDVNQHVNQFWNDSSGSHNQDLTVFVGGPSASAATGMTSWIQSDGPHALYVDTNQHVNQLWNDASGWHWQDLTVFVSGPHASATTGMTSWIQADGPHALYVDVNQHVNQFWNDSGGSHNQDLTVFVGGPSASPATGMTSWIQSDGPHALYVDSNQHVDQLWNDASGWHTQDLTVFVSGPDTSPATSFTSWIQPDGPHALYVDSNQHVDQLWNDASGWHWQDLTATVNGPLAAVPDTISGQVTAGGSGFSGVTVSLSGTTAAGTSVSRSTTTDANGNYSLAAPAGGSYTVTPSLAGYTFSPASYGFDNLSTDEIANFIQSSNSGSEDWNGFWGIPVNGSATPSGTDCGDISGTWTETDAYGSSTWNLTESNDGTVSGTVDFSDGPSCGTITYQTVNGQLNNGVFSLIASNPSALTDSCGYSIAPTERQQVALSGGSCSQGSASWASNFGAGTSSWQGQIPTSLNVVQNGVHVYSNAELVAAGFNSNCKGIIIGVTYQILDQKGKPYKVTGLVPQEMISNIYSNGVHYAPTPGLDPLVNFQFVDIYPGHSEKNTSSAGTFSDSPFGACAGDTGNSLMTASDTQQLRLVNPKNAGNWIVRTNNWQYSASQPCHGSVTNQIDVNASR